VFWWQRYTQNDWLQVEKETVFKQNWIVVGRADQVSSRLQITSFFNLIFHEWYSLRSLEISLPVRNALHSQRHLSLVIVRSFMNGLVTGKLLGEPLLITMDETRQVRAFFNVCKHVCHCALCSCSTLGH
jgi:hypothetical protein